MKVVLVKANWLNPKAWLITLFTWSKITHAGFLTKTEDQLYDASESRGNVDYGKTLKELGNVKIYVYDVPCDDKRAWDYLLSKRGVKYDWKGIMGWMPFFASNDPATVYCFELVLQTLLEQPILNGYETDYIARDLKQKLFKKPIDSDDIFVLMERLRLNPVYYGKAKNYLPLLK